MAHWFLWWNLLIGNPRGSGRVPLLPASKTRACSKLVSLPGPQNVGKTGSHRSKSTKDRMVWRIGRITLNKASEKTNTWHLAFLNFCARKSGEFPAALFRWRFFFSFINRGWNQVIWWPQIWSSYLINAKTRHPAKQVGPRLQGKDHPCPEISKIWFWPSSWFFVELGITACQHVPFHLRF